MRLQWKKIKEAKCNRGIKINLDAVRGRKTEPTLQRQT